MSRTFNGRPHTRQTRAPVVERANRIRIRNAREIERERDAHQALVEGVAERDSDAIYDRVNK